jgi:serine/threonine protein kinase
LAEAEAQHIFRQLVEGLSFLHSQGVIHRDLKPENVLVAQTRRGPGGIALLDVKIADFGLSKIVGEGFSEARSTVGSPRYMAPEVLAAGGSVVGAGAYDLSADLWSLGVLLHVLLDGRFPCDGMPKVAQARIDGAVAKLEVTSQARSVVSGLLRLRPEDRLGADDLRRHPWLVAAAKYASASGTSATGAARATKQPVVHQASAQSAAVDAFTKRRRRSSSSSMGSSSSNRRPKHSRPGPSTGPRGLRRRLSDGNIFSADVDAAIAEATAEVGKALASPKNVRGAPNASSSGTVSRRLPQLKAKATPKPEAKATPKAAAKRGAAAMGRAAAKGRARRLWGSPPAKK